MKSQDIIKALKADGWGQVAQKGSHVQFKHPTKTGRVTVPHPNKDVPIGTLRSIEKPGSYKAEMTTEYQIGNKGHCGLPLRREK